MRNFLFPITACLGCVALGAALTSFLYDRTFPGPAEFYLNDLSTAMGTLYNSDGDERSLDEIRDILSLRIANAVTLAGSYGAGHDELQARRVEFMVERLTAHDMLAAVKQQDARQSARAVVECWQRGASSTGSAVCPPRD